MLHEGVTAGYFKNHTVQINTLCGQNAEFSVLNRAVNILTTRHFEGVSNFCLLLAFRAKIYRIIFLLFQPKVKYPVQLNFLDLHSMFK
jgi:hypothetical protein